MQQSRRFRRDDCFHSTRLRALDWNQGGGGAEAVRLCPPDRVGTLLIVVGTSGWSHEAWVGPFYPVQLRAAPAEWLSYYATRFRTVEIASTFDVLPDEDLVAAWSRAGIDLCAQGPFEYSIKLPRAITHDALLQADVDRAWERAARFERQVLEPLDDEGLLGAVLVELPDGLKAEPDTIRNLTEVLSALRGRSIALDPHDASWFEHGRLARQVDDLFDDPDTCLVERDVEATHEPPPSKHAYLALSHGRRYSNHELAAWATRAAQREASERVVRAYFSNTTGAHAVANAVGLLHLLGEAAALPRPRLTQQSRLPV